MCILFYGNCQLNAICQTLNLDQNKFSIFNIPCHNTNISKEEFTTILNQCNLIVTQSIKDNYRNTDYLSTSYIINNATRSTCNIIIFDSCYFSFYHFDVEYKYFNNNILHNPVDYHHKYMIDSYHNNLSIEDYINNYHNNTELKSSEELEIIANNSLDELNRRYENNIKKYYNGRNVYFIPTYNFIKNNYKDKLLFYSINHLTKYLIQYICEEILNLINLLENNHLKNTINYHIDILSTEPKCLLYKCIQKNINFNLNEHVPNILGNIDIYEITKIYYDTYRSINY
jgi:hypothetical protein